MVFICVLLAMIIGVLAYVARLTIVTEARTRRCRERYPSSVPGEKTPAAGGKKTL